MDSAWQFQSKLDGKWLETRYDCLVDLLNDGYEIRQVLKDDRDQQYDMKVKAREQRDKMCAENKRLQEALKEIAEYPSNDATEMRRIAKYSLENSNV